MKKSNTRYVMPLDVRGRTRAILQQAACFYLCLYRQGNPETTLVITLNEKCSVSVSHRLALIMSLPFVHVGKKKCSEQEAQFFAPSRTRRFRPVNSIFISNGNHVPSAILLGDSPPTTNGRPTSSVSSRKILTPNPQKAFDAQ